MLGLFVIALLIIIAILGYLITPDRTPNANDQVLQIANEQPGFKITFLKKKKSKEIDHRAFFIGKMLHGKENSYELIPLISWKVEGTEFFAEQYGGKDRATIPMRYHLADLVYSVSNTDTAIDIQDDQIAFTDFEGNKISTTITDLKEQVESKQIVKRNFLLGTDKFGRDVLSRIIIGVRVSLSVGLIAVIISLSIGVLLGAFAGYFRGRFDDFVMWFINVVWSIPSLLLVFALSIALKRFIDNPLWIVYIAVGLTMWIEVARVIRGQVLSLREMQYVEAARALGYGDMRIVFLHILPNVIGPVMVISASIFANAILVEAGLSYLGIGVQPPAPSWGGMLNENYGMLLTSNAIAALIPGFAILISVLSFYWVGNGLRDAFDVKTNLKSNT